MANMGIEKKFIATHGTKEKKLSEYTVELIISGEIINGFVRNIDHKFPEQKLENTLLKLNEQYLDDIVGRATNENIAQFILYTLVEFSPRSIKIKEDKTHYVEVFFEEIDLEKYDVQLKYNKAQSLLLREELNKSIQLLDEAINSDNTFAEAYNLRGRCYKYLNKFDDALKNYEEAIKLKPDLGDAWRNKGNALLYLNEYKNMISAFTKSIELMPDSALAINNRGFAFFILGNFEDALKDHEAAINIDPKYAEAHYDKYMALKKMNKRKEATLSLLKFRDLKKRNEDTYYDVRMY